MPNMKTVDAEVIVQAINDIATFQPLFRTQEELERFMSAIMQIAEAVGTTVRWGDGGSQ